SGSTPYGAIAMPFAWTEWARGEDLNIRLALSSIAPRRDGTSPVLLMTVPPYNAMQPGTDIAVTGSLELCTRSKTVSGTLRLDQPAIDQGDSALPLAGSLSIDGEGWSVHGTFRTDFLCSGSF